MQIEFLGSGGYFPNNRRHTACVAFPELGIAFDAGTSAFRLPQRMRTGPLDIFLSHAHLDHICGLTYLLLPLLDGTLAPIRLFGTQKTLDAVSQHLLDGAVFPLRPEFEYHPLAETHEVTGGGMLTHHPLQHPGGSTGYRIDWPARNGQPARSMAYITDTVANGRYTQFIEDVDLLIHECYYPDSMSHWCEQTGHSHATPVGQIAREANVGRLIIVHIDPLREDDDPIDVADVKASFENVAIAEDEMAVTL